MSIESHSPDSIVKQVRIVAWVFIALGAVMFANTLADTFRGYFVLDFRVVFLFAGVGLLRRRNFWRRFAMVCALLVLVYSALTVGLLIASWTELMNVFIVMPSVWTALLAFISFFVSDWVCWMLSRPKVEQFFISQAFE